MNIPEKKSITTTYTYDAAGNLVTLTDSENQTTTYAYDLLGRLYTMAYPTVTGHNGTTTYTYDLRGALIEVNDPNGSRFVLVRDYLGWLTERQIARATGVVGTTLQEFEYDRLGRLTRAEDDNGSNPNAVTTYVYDAAGRLLKEGLKIGSGSWRTVESTYDDSGTNKLDRRRLTARAGTLEYDLSSGRRRRAPIRRAASRDEGRP